MPQLIIKIVDRGTNHTNQKTGGYEHRCDIWNIESWQYLEHLKNLLIGFFCTYVLPEVVGVATAALVRVVNLYWGFSVLPVFVFLI